MSAAPNAPRGPPLTPTDLGIGRLFDAIRDGVVVSDAEGRILLWNQGATEIFGWTDEEARGRNVSILVPESHRARHQAGMERFARTGHGPLLDTRRSIELPALRKDGSQIHVDLTLSTIDHGGRRYALALLRETTERVRLMDDLRRRGAQLERSNAELARANESLTAFTYVVSHDLKEPVRAIDAYLRILQEDHGASLPPEGAEVLARARSATGRLAALLRGLLDLGRLDREQPARRPLDLREVLESDACRAVFEGLVHERGASLETPLRMPPVLAPEALLCQVLSNLVTNAVRHNPAARPRVRVGARPDGEGLVEVAVEDDGPGFPPDLLERFNNPGAKTQESLRTGFGLLIARRAVERMGGRMRLDVSEELGGAAVRFTVPAAP